MQSKRTVQLSIPIEVKKRVADRDSVQGWPCCVWCGKPAPIENRLAYSNAHYIARSQGGLGIYENILTLCPVCHQKYDQSGKRDDMRRFFRIYLTKMCAYWDEKNLIYRRDENAESH